MSDSPDITNVEVDGHRLRLSSLDKVLYPATETTKGEVLHYYTAVADRLLRQLRGRPVTRVRFPHGVTESKFFEKNTPSGVPSWIAHRHLDGVDYPFVESAAGVLFFANLAALEFHTPQWRAIGDTPPRPDRLVIDLDPGAPAGLDECARIALLLADTFESMGLKSVPVTSGSKGMQIYAALGQPMEAAAVRDLAHALADKLAELQPELVVARMTKSLRPGKVFLDWSQNTVSKTTITPWSLRGRSTPNVALPRTWAEISEAVENPGTLRHPQLDEVLTTRLTSPDPMIALGD